MDNINNARMACSNNEPHLAEHFIKRHIVNHKSTALTVATMYSAAGAYRQAAKILTVIQNNKK